MPSRKVTHGISDIKILETESSMFCQCGWDDFAENPDALNVKFQDHRASLGLPRRFGITELVGTDDNEFQRSQHQGDVWYTSGFSRPHAA